MNTKCQYCGKELTKEQLHLKNKYCSKNCFKKARHEQNWTKKYCLVCGKEFEVYKNAVNKPNCKRFCSTSCSAKWRIANYGVPDKSEKALKHLSDTMKKTWEDKTFRDNNKKRMIENNPMHMKGVPEKAKATILKNGGYTNNYRYGNGKISEYEKHVYDFLLNLGFYYNYAINTKLARDAFPDANYAHCYKPDFTNLNHKICIEIDGCTHDTKAQKLLDAKKDKCLTYLGFKVYRFTHSQIDSGEFFKEVDTIWQNCCQNDTQKK